MACMAKVLAIDLDGTLFYPKGHHRLVSKKNTEFLRRFIDGGNRVVLVSSRGEDIIKRVVKEIERPLDYLASTGAIMCIDNQIVQDISMDNEIISYILKKIKEDYAPLAYVMSCKNSPWILSVHVKSRRLLEILYKTWYKLTFGIYREKFIIDEGAFKKQLFDGKIYSVNAFFGLGKKAKKANKELNKIIREKYPQIESSWMGLALEFSPKGCNKGAAVKFYADYIGINQDNVYVIGDSGNDISMFNQYYNNSFVMAHSYPSVKKYAKHKISRVYKVEKYLFERS